MDGNARVGSSVLRNFNATGWQQVKLPRGLSARDGMQSYLQLGGVLCVEPNTILPSIRPSTASTDPIDVSQAGGDVSLNDPSRSATVRRHGPFVASSVPPLGAIPNDPRFRQQWYHGRIGSTNVWSTTTGSTNIVVAVLDTGVNYRHEDLAANMWRNPGEVPGNGVDDDGNGFVDDIHGIDAASDSLGHDSDPFDEGYGEPRFYHGTVCAGLIGAVGNNGKGIAGVNWAVRIMAIRIGTTNDLNKIADIIEGYEYIISMKRRGVNIRVANNSYGSDPRSVFSQALKDAIDAAGNEGILNVFAANAPSLTVDLDLVPRYPVRFDSPSMIVVGASSQSDNLAWVSSFGRTGVDLAAPGLDIASTFGPGPSDYIAAAAGTSFSCPIVAGAAALILSVDPSLTVDGLKAAILGSVAPAAGLRGKFVTNGRLDLGRALKYIGQPDQTAIVVSALPGGPRTAPDAPIRVVFSRPMNRRSVEDAFVLEPSVIGRFEWSDDSRALAFAHEAPFDSNSVYTVRIRGEAQDESGRTLDGDYDQVREGGRVDDFVWTFSFPVVNDDFGSARTISGPAGTISGSNRFASVELDEPSPLVGEFEQFGMSVWYRWKAPDTGGWFTFDLAAGTTFDSLLAIYTGDRIDQKSPIAGNDNYGLRLGSRVSFQAVPSLAYSIAVVGKSAFNPSFGGAFHLAWFPTPPPGFTGTQFSPMSGTPGTRISLTGTNFAGTSAVHFNGASAHFTRALTNSLDLRLTVVVPPDARSGPITVLTPYGSVTSSASFEVLPPPLAIRRTPENQIEISWPATGNAFVLESTVDLGSPLWEAFGTRPGMAEGQSRVVTSIGVNGRYFRLRSQP